MSFVPGVSGGAVPSVAAIDVLTSPSPAERASPAADGPKRHVVPPGLVRLPPDRYGQSHPVETREAREAALRLLDSELEKLGEEDATGGVRAAERRFREVVRSEEHRMMFLRCEMFNVDLAAKRMASYWKRRISLFGDEDAFAGGLTLDGPLRNDGVALRAGFVRLLPGTDDVGRALVLIEPARLSGTGYTRESMVRSVWYVMHAALESETCQRKGIIALVNLRGVRTRHFDRALIGMIADSLKGVLPIRLSAMHMCHPPSVFGLVFPLIKFFLGERLRKRIRMHTGSEGKVLGALAEFGLTADKVPAMFGGAVEVNHDEWLAERGREGK